MSLVQYGSAADRFPRRWLVVSSFGLVLLAIAPYLPAMKAGWFFDSLILLDKPDFHSVDTAARELWDGKWFPGQSLTILTFSLNRALNEMLGRAGTDPRIFLATNIAIHAGAALLFFCLLRELARISNRQIHPFAPFLAAAFFAVHPLNVTSVTYIVQRRGELATVFFLAGLFAFLRARMATSLRRIVLFSSLTAFCAWAAMHSKSAGATLPVAILALEFCIRAPHRDRCLPFLRLAAPALLICATAAVFFLVKINALDWQNRRFNAPGTMVGELGFTWPEYLLTQARAFTQYWSLIVWPASSRLCVDHDFIVTRGFRNVAPWICALFHVSMLVLAAWWACRGRLLAGFGILLFYVALLAWIAPPQPILFVEYRLYLPLAAALMAAAGVLTQRVFPAWLPVIAAPILVFLAITTWHRNIVMADNISLWDDVVRKNPDYFRGHYNLANALFQNARFEEAMLHYRESCRIDTEDYRCHFNLANTFMKLGRTQEAQAEYQETIRRKPDHAGARLALRRLGVEVRVGVGESRDTGWLPPGR